MPSWEKNVVSLKDLKLEYEYRSDTANLVDSFYVPCLRESTEYCRAVGYFTSGGLALAARGLAAFVGRNGRMRLVAGPVLQPEDVEAFSRGYRAKEDIVEKAVLRQLGGTSLDGASPILLHRLECLAWLIADDRLEIKLAFPTKELRAGNPGIYHEKIGIFLDAEDNSVAFTGSPNETTGGLVNNFESFDVYVSWEDGQGRVARKKENFERLWKGTTVGLDVLDFPLAARKKLLQLRPYARPVQDPEGQATKEERAPYDSGDSIGALSPIELGIPKGLVLRSYQEQARAAWLENGGRGFLAMATGSGKTISSLASAISLVRREGSLFIIVACPFLHLVEQWANEARRFGFHPILACENRNRWEPTVNSCLLDFKLGNREVVLVIATHSTLMGTPMQGILARIKGPALLIADEAHHLGASEGRKKLPEAINFRMALSATPSRWFDEEGSQALANYFGPTVFEFSIAQAIAEGCLSEYYYYPHVVDLEADEYERYKELSAKIALCFASGAKPGEDSGLDSLLRKRADILNQAANKIPILSDLLSKDPQIDHALFYCVPGQLDQVVRLLGHQLGIRVHRFTMEETSLERSQLLRDFAEGRLQALAAIRCLDEGVDVPSSRIAYLLASSSNPREFIQRRGRILRKAPDKAFAIVHDLITVPSRSHVDGDSDAFNAERRILKRELARFKEFADSSRNRFQANEVIWEIAKAYNLLDF